MADKDICGEISELLLSQSGGEELPDHAKEHIRCCEKCKEYQEKLIKMNSLVKSSMPACPDIRNKVIDRIKDENIKIAQPKQKHHFPLGAMAAAAAVFAVYISVYGTKLPDMILNMNDTAVEEGVCDEESEIVLEAETSEQFNYVEKAMFKKAEMPFAAEFSRTKDEALFLNDVCDSVDCDDAASGGDAITVTGAKKEAVAEAETETVTESATDAEEFFETESASEEKAEPEMLFEKYSQLYPDEISLETVEEAGWEVYRDFVISVENEKAEYTLEEFLKFAQ